MNKEQEIQNINLLSAIIEKGKGNPHFTTKELENALQSNCDNILYGIPLENIIKHLLNNRDREILIPNYFLPEHILQEVKERFDKDLTTEEAKDIIENLSDIDNLSERITETVFEFVNDMLSPELEKEEDLKQIITYHDTEETIKKEVFFKNKDGEKHGLCQSFYENGETWVKSTYKDGKIDGLCQKFYKNGNIWIECTYKDGKLDGLYKWFDNDGNLISTIMLYKWFDNDGNLISTIIYKNGIPQ